MDRTGTDVKAPDHPCDGRKCSLFDLIYQVDKRIKVKPTAFHQSNN